MHTIVATRMQLSKNFCADLRHGFYPAFPLSLSLSLSVCLNCLSLSHKPFFLAPLAVSPTCGLMQVSQVFKECHSYDHFRYFINSSFYRKLGGVRVVVWSSLKHEVANQREKSGRKLQVWWLL